MTPDSVQLMPRCLQRLATARSFHFSTRVLETSHPVIIPKVSEEPLFLDRIYNRRGPVRGEVSFICVPIICEYEVLGTLSVDQEFNPDNSIVERVAFFEQNIIIDALKQNRGNMTAAAQSLATTPRILRYKIQQYGIDFRQYAPK